MPHSSPMLTHRSPFFHFLLVACALLSCRPAVKTPPDTLVVGIEAPPATVDPRLAVDAYSAKIARLIHNGLFRLDERLRLQPDLIDGYEQVSPTEYRFRLKPGLLFHDRTTCDAEDAAYTLRSLADPRLGSPFRATMEKIAEIIVPDPLTLIIKLKEPFSPLLSALTLGIVPSEGNAEIGTGPFRLESFRPSEAVVLQKNDGYFQGDPRMNKVLFRVIPDDNLRVLEIKNRRVDVLQNNVPPLLLSALKDDAEIVLETTEGINMTYLGMNLREERLAGDPSGHPPSPLQDRTGKARFDLANPLSKVEVRRAIAHALDIPALIEFRMAGLARPATGLLAPIHWAYDGDVTTYPFDPKKARELLDQAGYPDPDGAGPQLRFALTYKTSTKKDRIGLARLIARYLKDVGIEVRVLPFDWGVFFSDVNKGNFELYSLTWVGVTEPDIYYDVFHSSRKPPEGLNRGGFESPVIDKLTEEGRKTSDLAVRRDLYAGVQKELARELPIIPLWYESNYAVFGKNVKGLRLRPNASFEWAAEVSKE